jgi:hypothetical protein
MVPGTHVGLVDVATSDLERALRAVHKGELAAPVTPLGLSLAKLQHCSAPLMANLRGLDAAGVRAVLVAVLAERRQAR